MAQAGVLEVEPDARAALLAGRRRRFAPGEVVFHQGDRGDAVHLVTAGTLAATTSSLGGRHMTVGWLRRGDIFGELAVLDAGERHTTSVVARTAAETRCTDRERFAELRAGDLGLDRLLVSVLADRNRELVERLGEHLFDDVPVRVAKRLAALLRAADVQPGGVVDVNQEELAAIAGTTRASANRALRELERRGAISLQRGRVVLLDPALLRR